MLYPCVCASVHTLLTHPRAPLPNNLAKQKMLYPYLPEPMRNPETFEWMLRWGRLGGGRARGLAL